MCRVAVVERAEVKGREQEWNISRKELKELVSHRVLVIMMTQVLQHCTAKSSLAEPRLLEHL